MARIRLRRPGRRSRDEYQRIYRAGRAERRRPASRQNGRRRASGRKYLSAETERRALRGRPLRVDSCPVGRSPVHDLCDPPDMPDQADELRGQLRLQRSLADPHLVHRSLHRQAEPAQGLLRRHPDGAQRPALMDGRRPPVAGSLHGGLRKLRFRKAKPLLHLDPVQRHRGLLALLGPEPGRLFRLYGRPADVRPAERKRLQQTGHRLRALRQESRPTIFRLGRTARSRIRESELPGVPECVQDAVAARVERIQSGRRGRRLRRHRREVRRLRRTEKPGAAGASRSVRIVRPFRGVGCRERRLHHARSSACGKTPSRTGSSAFPTLRSTNTSSFRRWPAWDGMPKR